MRLSLPVLGVVLLLAACEASTPAPTPTVAVMATPEPMPQGQAVVASPRLPATPVARPVAEWADRIAYRGDDDGLWLMKPDGSDRQLVHLPADTGSPAYDTRFVWSPDGSRIAFVNGSDLLVADLPAGITHLIYRSHTAPGSGPESILPAPAWDPDGMAVAFIDGRTLRIVELDTGQVSVVADDVWSEAWANDPGGSVAWSADGRYLLYLRSDLDTDQLRGLAAVRPHDPGQSRLVEPNVVGFALSPNGRRIVYRLRLGGLWLAEARCVVSRPTVDCPSVPTRLVLPSADPGFFRLRWSPRGVQFLALSPPGHLWLINIAGHVQRVDLGGPAFYETNSWSSDGHKLVLAFVYDGGMTSSPLIIYDLMMQKTTLLSGFEAFGKQREAAWSRAAFSVEPPTTPIEPLATAAALRFDSWSPGGEWLAYWVSSEEDVTNGYYPFPRGILQLFNIHTGQTCSYSEFVARDYGDRVAWQPDGQIVVIAGELARRGPPCGSDFVPTDDRPEPDQDESNSALSPGGTYRATTLIRSEAIGRLDVKTTFVDAASGRVIEVVEWSHPGGLGGLGLGGQWLTDDRFLVYQAIDRGPLLVDVGKEIVEVAPELFGVPPVQTTPTSGESPIYSVPAIASGSVISDTNVYHILLRSADATHMYHSETGEAEKLPFQSAWFSPDGRWLLMDERPVENGHETSAIWVRPVDPIGSEPRLLISFGGSTYNVWSSDLTKVVFSSLNGIAVFAVPEWNRIGTWDVGSYYVHPAAWSPDGEFLIVQGNIPGKWQYALFLIRVSPQ